MVARRIALSLPKLVLCLGVGLVANAHADVLYRGFEPGTDGLSSVTTHAHPGCSSSIQLDTTAPLSGKGSALFSFSFGSNSANPVIDFTFGQLDADNTWKPVDLRKATGLHFHLKTELATSPSSGTTLFIMPCSNWYPLPHILKGMAYGWTIDLQAGTLDTTLPFSGLDLRPYFKTLPLSASLPPSDTILQGVIGFDFQVYPTDLTSPAIGSFELDSVVLTGIDEIPAGTDPKKVSLFDFDDTTFASSHKDSVPGVYTMANAASTAKISSVRGDSTAWGTITPECTYTIVASSDYTAWVGCGFRGAAWDLTGTTRFEFAEAASAAGKYRINLISDRYPKVLLDSGVVWGWDSAFAANVTNSDGIWLAVKDLAVPSWASSKTALLAKLPPIDSILKGVDGFQILPDLSWNGATIPSPSSGYIRFDHFLAVGVDTLIPSALASSTTDAKAKGSILSSLRLRGRFLRNDGIQPARITSPNGRLFSVVTPGSSTVLPQGVWIVEGTKFAVP
jgi:hypothetical protein